MSKDNYWGNETNYTDEEYQQSSASHVVIDEHPAGTNQVEFDSDEYEYEEVEEVVDDVNGNSRVAEAIKRIEQAKLYESLLKHDFFAPGSARPEIQISVTEEIRSFILQRLEELLGLKEERVVGVESGFNDEEKDALRAVALRLTQKKQNAPSNPTVRPYQPSNPEVQVAQTQVSEPYNPTKKVVKRVVKKKKASKKTADPNEIQGDYQKPAISKKYPPKPMPKQAVMDQMNAQQAASNASNSPGGADMSALLGAAVKVAQHQNKDVEE